ncbi:MAG: hypothetical protein K2J69_01945 [Malacoplasma sp.]|nr:hypothetical protein [Malacoplasma sp.]
MKKVRKNLKGFSKSVSNNEKLLSFSLKDFAFLLTLKKKLLVYNLSVQCEILLDIVTVILCPYKEWSFKFAISDDTQL